ncbi:MAG: class I SAM-dependent methyltransferase [Mycobacteriaceae bacterium]|nr:class I SAM-dependent methyltransferase [Mycobacteriaceae bacterium]
MDPIAPVFAGAPSPTALAAALIRAYHQVGDDPLVFSDPLAVPVAGVGPELLRMLGGDDPARRQRRLFLAVRHRVAEDVFLSSNAAQALILGAGLDTFGYRHPTAAARVFEVDLPAVLDWKRERLAAAAVSVPECVRFVATDLEQRTLAADLAAAGFDPALPTCVSWLGGTMYATEDTVAAVLNVVGALTGPTRLVLDYVQSARVSPARHDGARRVHLELSAALGEPWITQYEPDHFAAVLRNAGLTPSADESPAEALTPYLPRPEPTGPDPDVTRRLVQATADRTPRPWFAPARATPGVA